jgi:flagellar hook-associated protein 3 FlgL
MRISSNTYFTGTLTGMLNQQSAISTLNQQIASGNKLLTAADDPVAASQVMALNDRISLSTQYSSNQQSVGLAQSEETTILNQFQSNLASVQSALSSVNSSNDTNLKDSVAATLSGLYQQIKDLANSQDSSGNYIFSGFSTSTQPYVHTAIYGTGTATSSASTYQGDNGLRQVQIGQGQTVQSNDNLSSVMQSGSASDLLQTIDQTAADLKNNSVNLQTQLNNAYSVITTALGNLQNVQAGLAARQQQVTSQQTTTQQLQATNQDALANLTQVDQASAIVELQMRQTSLQAAESAFASTSKLSLFNYL